jgi:hypothetical protein
MNTLILFWYLVCSGGMCETVPFTITREAMAIASCESGDGHNFGTFTLRARSHTADGGIWQFNDKTYMWLVGRTHADTDDPNTQYDAFIRLWDDGYGWRHWKASKTCWSQWMTIDGDKAVWIER